MGVYARRIPYAKAKKFFGSFCQKRPCFLSSIRQRTTRMNITFEAKENTDGTWRVVLARPGHAETSIETFAHERDAIDWIETKAGDWLKGIGGDF
jgi:hypothetical protein